MYYGTDISASGVLTAMHRLDALANNLANIDTVGYKPVSAMTMQREPVRQEDGLGFMPSNELMERLGAGVLMAPSRVQFRQGPIETTGNDLDVAVEGDGFLVTRTGTDGDVQSLSLTRDGRMAIDRTGTLVQAASGLPILDAQHRPIHLHDNEPVNIDNDGMVYQSGSRVAQIQLVDVSDYADLTPAGEGLYRPNAAAISSFMPGSGRIIQRAVEGSAVNEVAALLQMQGASSAVNANIGVMSYQDRLAERAINTFARLG